uniref:Ig-like domain-containing protein n=1 Tax=Meleagris gallopavo TaxID=9103 RepID=A0A803YJB2_MELGA
MQGLKCRSVLEGDPAVFQCKLVACPPPHMAWFHNNRPVRQDCRKVIRTESEEHTHRASLEVQDVQEHDAGSYRVFAINSEGSAESAASLLVARSSEQRDSGFVGKVQLVQEKWECLLQQRQQDRLRVVLRCTGSPFDKGQEAEQQLPNFSARGKVRTIRFQRLPSVESHRLGIVHGRERSRKLVNAEELLDEEIRWKLQRLREAKKAVLKKKQESFLSETQGGPPGKPCPPEAPSKTDGSEPFQMPEVEKYSMPKVAEKKWKAHVGLLEPCPPLFVQGVRPQEAVEGQRVTFSCLFHGCPKPTITWYNNTNPVGRIRGTAVHTTECRSTLTFSPLLPQHSGTVMCVISNPLGSVSTSAALYVRQRMLTYKVVRELEKDERKKKKEKAKEEENKKEEKEEEGDKEKEKEKKKQEKEEEEEEEQEKEEKEEREVSLAFAEEQGLPNTFPDSDLLSLPVEIKITAPTPTPEQDTEIKETMQSSPGQAAPAIKHKFKFSFDVRNEPPQIVSEAPAHIHCCEGEAVVLQCSVSGQPPPSVTWSWNGQNLSASERLSFEKCEAGTHRLHIRGVSVSDAGLYCCVAKNVAGTAQSASELTVQPSASRLYSKDGDTEELPAMNPALCLSTPGKEKEEQITCSEEEEGHLPWSLQWSPSPSEQVGKDFGESRIGETILLDVTEVCAKQKVGYAEECVGDAGDISKMKQHSEKAVSEEHDFEIDATVLHPRTSREKYELVAKDSGHFSEELETEGDKLAQNTDSLSWDVLKSPLTEMKQQMPASEQSALAKEHEDLQFSTAISALMQEETDSYLEDSDASAWEAMASDMSLVDKLSVPHLQDNSTLSKDPLGLQKEEQQEEWAKEQERLVDIEQDIEVNVDKEELIDAGESAHKINIDGQLLQERESDVGIYSLDLVLPPPDIENSGQEFTEEVEVHPDVHFKEQLLPSETDETSIILDLKKFVEPFPAEENMDTKQVQIPTALESVEVGEAGLISPVHECEVLVEEMSLSEVLCPSHGMQEEVSAQEEVRQPHLQIANGNLGSITSAEERTFAEEIHKSEANVCWDSPEGQIHSYLLESTADFQRTVQEMHIWESEERLEPTEFESDTFISDLKKAAQEKKPQTWHQAEEEGSSRIEKVFEKGVSCSTSEIESTGSPEGTPGDTQQEPNITKDFSFGKLLLGLTVGNSVAQKEQKKESWAKKRSSTIEASENSLDGEEMWEDVSAGPEPSADQVSEPEPDLSLAKYLRSTGIQEAPNIKGTVQKEQRETITSLEVEEVTFSAVYDYYKNQQELTRPFSPESEMSIELESGSGEESPDSDRFYTPPSSVEIFETASSASYHTPLGTPERYSTPSEGSGYRTPPERYSTPSEHYSTPSEGSEYSTPPERYSTPSESSGYRTPPERYSTPSEESNYSMPPECYSTPSGGSKHNTPSECYFTPFEGLHSASGDITPPENYWTPIGEYKDALAVFPPCEERYQAPEQPPRDEVFRTPREAREPSGNEMPPAFLKALSRKRLYEGSTLSFVAEVVGVPEPGVKWYHNKSLLEVDKRVRVEKDGDKCVLEITNIQKDDEGQYLCHAVNIVGEAKSIAQVEVLPEDGQSLALPPPVTHQHVIQFDLEENTSSRSPSPQEILLEVELDEDEVKEFEKQVKIITSPEFSPDKKSMVVSLDVLPLALLEQVSGFTSEENEDVKIDFQVTEMPPRFAVPFTDVKVTEGSEAVFECVVTGTPVPVVQWFRGDTCVTPIAGKYVVSQKEGLHSLKVLNVGPSDGGWYHCQAINRLGEAMCKGSVIVTGSDLQGASAMASSETDMGSEPERPEKCDLLSSKAKTSEKWSEVEMECEFKTHAEDSRRLEVTEQEHEVEGEKSVSINCDVSREPSQKEEVESRAEETQSCSSEFQVAEVPPKFLRLISDYSTFVGASVCFQCLVTGSPHPSVHWYKDGMLLEGDRYYMQEEEGGSHSLTIDNLMQSDSGLYKCIAINRVGTAETCALLTLY